MLMLSGLSERVFFTDAHDRINHIVQTQRGRKQLFRRVKADTGKTQFSLSTS